MSGSYSPAADAYVSMTAGNAGAAGTGAHTIAALFKTVASGTMNTGLVNLLASGTQVRQLIMDSGFIFGAGDFSSGGPSGASFSLDTWYLVAISKPAGSAIYRCHYWPYSSTGSGTMLHGSSGTAANHGDGSAITEIRIGKADTRGNGLIAVVGIWNSELTDTQLDSLKSGNLSAWASLTPAELISMENWNGSTGCTAVRGTSSQSSLTGTISVGGNPPSFNFSLGTNLSDAVEAGSALGRGTVVRSVINRASNVEAGYAGGTGTRASYTRNLASAVEAGHAEAASTKAISARSLASAVEAGSALGRSTRAVSATSLASTVEAGHALAPSTRVVSGLAFSLSDAVEAASAFAGSSRTTSAANRRTDVEAAFAAGLSTRVSSVKNLVSSVEAGGASARSTVVKTLRVLSHNVDGSFSLVGSVSIRSNIGVPSDGFVIPGGLLALSVPVSSLIDFGPADGEVDVLIVGRTDLGDLVGVVDVSTMRGSVSL